MKEQLNRTQAQSREWAVHQIVSCADYNTDSLLWRTLSIGLNAQAIHHLFPGVRNDPPPAPPPPFPRKMYLHSSKLS